MDVIGCTPIKLQQTHSQELFKLIGNLREDVANPSNRCEENNLERFEKLILLYSDEPQLLDPIIPDMIRKIIELIEWPLNNGIKPSPITVSALNRLQIISRTRGYKIVIRFLPHEVNYLEQILNCLEFYASNFSDVAAQSISYGSYGDGLTNSADGDRRIVYVLSVWLLIICKNPFSLTKFDKAVGSSNEKPIAQRIIDCMGTLHEQYIPLGEMVVVSTLLAQILTRNIDNSGVVRPRFEHALITIKSFESELEGGQKLISQIRLLISLFKWGKRKEMKAYAEELIQNLSETLLNVDCRNSEVRNLVTKLLQRIALVLLRKRFANWRYKCGHRNLEESLKLRALSDTTSNEKQITSQNRKDEEEEEEEEDSTIPYDLIEMIIDDLIIKLHDRENLIRWTAAKGLARICSRLPKEMGSQVVQTILDANLDETKPAGHWHGQCLALAELCRRGCLLPDQVPMVIKIVSKALLFEQSITSLRDSVGVRDAACFICWAFARAYEPKLMQKNLGVLAGDLASLALFDREVNIRRAASAAFQENVGRNDAFPNGIQVLAIIDYVDVALIKNCYLDLAVKVANYLDYRQPLLYHLCQFKSQHWDEVIREMAANSLQRLVEFDVDYAKNHLLPQFHSRLASRDVTILHGVIFAIAGVLIGLHRSDNLKESLNGLPQNDLIFKTIATSNVVFKDHRVKGFAMIFKALCRLIHAICECGTLLEDSQLKEYHDILDHVLGDKNEKLHAYTYEGYRYLMNYYMDSNERFELLKDRIFKKYFVKIEQNVEDELIRCASIVPLGHIPKVFLERKVFDNGLDSKENDEVLLKIIVKRLLLAIFDKTTPTWVFSRVVAINTLTSILTKTVPVNFKWEEVIDSFIYASDDYTATKNGDIGKFVRKAAINALASLLPLWQKDCNSEPEKINICIGKIIQRCCEPIDDLRSMACCAIGQMLKNHKDAEFLKQVEDLEILQAIFITSEANPIANTDEFQELDWLHAKSFMRLKPLLDSKTFSGYALEGFILSAGSISKWTSENAFLAMSQHVKPLRKKPEALEEFLESLFKILKRITTVPPIDTNFQCPLQKTDPTPLLQLLKLLFNDRIFAICEKDPDSFPIFTKLCQEIIRLLSMLESPYSSMKSCAIEQLFNFLSLFSVDDSNDGKSECINKALEILTNTPWQDLQLNLEVNSQSSLSVERKKLEELLLL